MAWTLNQGPDVKTGKLARGMVTCDGKEHSSRAFPSFAEAVSRGACRRPTAHMRDRPRPRPRPWSLRPVREAEGPFRAQADALRISAQLLPDHYYCNDSLIRLHEMRSMA